MPKTPIQTPDEERSLFNTVSGLFPAHGESLVAAAVGGGGKTSLLFALAEGFAGEGSSVALTTTTHLRDPRAETGRRWDSLILGSGPPSSPVDAADAARIVVVAAGPCDGERLKGFRPAEISALRQSFGVVLVEADGSRGLPVKAPASHEPVIPSDADIVIGVIGLDCLGWPMDEKIVHRPELFGPLTGCGQKEPITPEHLLRLAQAPEGLFKGAPAGATRVVLLNKTDQTDAAALFNLRELFSTSPPEGVDAVVFSSLVKNRATIIAHWENRDKT